MKNIAQICLAAAILAACGTYPDRPDKFTESQAILEAYTTHAGPASHQVVLPRVHAWVPVGENYIAVRTGGNRYYLLDLDLACSEAFRPIGATRLVFEQKTPNTLSAFDFVRINGQPCRIRSIHPIDHQAVYAELADKGIRQGFIRAERS